MRREGKGEKGKGWRREGEGDRGNGRDGTGHGMGLGCIIEGNGKEEGEGKGGEGYSPQTSIPGAATDGNVNVVEQNFTDRLSSHVKVAFNELPSVVHV